MSLTDLSFLLVFLPVVLAGYSLMLRRNLRTWAAAWLLFASAAFYCSWRPVHLAVLTASIAMNYAVAAGMASSPRRRRPLLIFGLVSDCVILAAFKYLAPVIDTLNRMAHLNLAVPSGGLPLGISFFTFVEIAYLLEVYRGEIPPADPIRFGLLVSFFPKVMAGPIVRPSEFLAEGEREAAVQDVCEGLFLFAVGLAKKTLLADHLARWAAPVFAGAGTTSGMGFAAAWIGVLAYTCQIYFDFSGYSDMAIGLARLFGYRVPVNFNSPYKAASVVEFWRRWHITLTGFLTEHVYFRLPGQRKGAWRRHLNLLVTMVACGIWHGAGWMFAFWGALHGVFLIVNHLWRSWRAKHSPQFGILRWKAPLAARGLTMAAVVGGWVAFGAPSARAAVGLATAMTGAWGIGSALTTEQVVGCFWVAACGALACVGPNSQELVGHARGILARAVLLARNRNAYWFVPGLIALWVLGMLFMMSRKSEVSPFIYAIF